MSLVVDSSVLVAALLDTGPDGAWAEQVIDGRALYAPELVLVEVTNVLRRLERAKRISTPEANAAQEDLMQLDIELFSFEPFADRIWELRQTVTSYDAWYVAVAEALEFPLATLDERLARAEGAKCEFLTPGSRQIITRSLLSFDIAYIRQRAEFAPFEANCFDALYEFVRVQIEDLIERFHGEGHQSLNDFPAWAFERYRREALP